MGIIKKTVAAAAAMAALTITVGCSQEDGHAQKEGAAGTSADPSRVDSLVLDAADFPSGYEVMEIPADKMQEIADSVLTGTKSAKVTPASCMQMSAIPDDIDISKVGMRMASKQLAVLTETVVAEDQQLATVRKQVEGECKQMTVEITEGPAAGAKGKVTSSVVDSPATEGRDAIVVQQNTEMSVQGQRVETKTVVGYAVVDGYTVTVQAANSSGGNPDVSAFDELFTKAIEKVEKQTA
ncbi:hypothetical protein [Gordonia shandongensis]|uniref:hypothetical protein n=1 Tax=Gordonia shandongensis TaxID=376351 RepID=UPI000415E8FA|nr:hypothetical protein [Gordonia shandongensis]